MFLDYECRAFFDGDLSEDRRTGLPSFVLLNMRIFGLHLRDGVVDNSF